MEVKLARSMLHDVGQVLAECTAFEGGCVAGATKFRRTKREELFRVGSQHVVGIVYMSFVVGSR